MSMDTCNGIQISSYYY